jgi:hypothetical protein
MGEEFACIVFLMMIFINSSPQLFHCSKRQAIGANYIGGIDG